MGTASAPPHDRLQRPGSVLAPLVSPDVICPRDVVTHAAHDALGLGAGTHGVVLVPRPEVPVEGAPVCVRLVTDGAVEAPLPVPSLLSSRAYVLAKLDRLQSGWMETYLGSSILVKVSKQVGSE